MQSLHTGIHFYQPRTTAPRRHAAWKLGLVAAVLAAVSLPAWAELPAARDSGGTTYVTGGISDDQSQAFKAAARQWPLAISLVQRSAHTNEYTASALVKIVDAQGRTVLDAQADGPFMLVRLPPGTYQVSADLNGHVLRRERVQIVDARPVKLDFVFPPNAS
ncbi:MAG: carboxypeptidase regulatory-like domain-containing protein [Aquabacterium sp.]|nr:MAG: carboxypeptidase regulatory-like domain-containing protein [Aquabacterium sp.]